VAKKYAAKLLLKDLKEKACQGCISQPWLACWYTNQSFCGILGQRFGAYEHQWSLFRKVIKNHISKFQQNLKINHCVVSICGSEYSDSNLQKESDFFIFV
jgi:hypothetical protein